jgi:signal transduction histidine kinase
MPGPDVKLNPSLTIAALQRLSKAVLGAKSVLEAQVLVDRELEFARAANNPRDTVGSYQQRGRSFFDELQLEILALVRAARSREDLLRLVIGRLAAGSAEERAAICYIVFEGRSIAEGHIEVTPILQAGLQVDRFQAFASTSSKFHDSPILGRLFTEGHTVDFSYTEYLRDVGYNGEFDMLVDDRKRGIWMAGVPLPGIDASMPDRALIGLYPSTGPVDLPSLPRGARPEWRLMEFLQTGYALLNHQLEGRAEIVAADRRSLIADLAPQAINHELATQLGALENLLSNILEAAKKLQNELQTESHTVGQIVGALTGGFNAIYRAKRITDAFNNLERRAAKTTIRVRDLVEEVHTIVDYRRKEVGAALILDGDGLDVELRTDAALVEHLLLNIVINAIDAFDGRPKAVKKDSEPRIVVTASRHKERMRFTICNNGPPIESSQREVIFEKGITSKKRGHGHGQGLYICRLVASYIFGSIELLNDVPPGMNVGFAVEVPIVARHGEDLMGQRARSRR